MLHARDRIRAKMREAVADGRASRRSKHQKALSDAAAVAEEQEAAAAASQRKNAHVLRAVAKLLEEKDRIARSAVVAQHNNLQLAKELGAGEPDEELLEGAEDTEPDQAVVAGSAEPPPKRRGATPAEAQAHVAQADRILKKAADLQEQKALMRAAKEAAERAGQSTKGAALRTLLRRLCKHSQTDARELEEKVDAWSAAAPSQTDGSKDEGRVAGLLQPVGASKEPRVAGARVGAKRPRTTVADSAAKQGALHYGAFSPRPGSTLKRRRGGVAAGGDAAEQGRENPFGLFTGEIKHMALPAFRHAGRKVYNGFWPGRRIPKYKFFQNDMAPTVFITAPLFPMVSKGQTLQPSDVEGDHSRGASSTQGSAGPAPAAEPQEACATRGIKKSPGTAEDPPFGTA